MVSTLEDRSGGVNRGNGPAGKFQNCPGANCKTKIRNQPLCTPCLNKLPRQMRERLETDFERVSEGHEPDEFVLRTCLEELQNQRVEQINIRRTKRK